MIEIYSEFLSDRYILETFGSSMPDGAPHCDISQINHSKVSIFARITDFQEFGKLLCVLDALNRKKIKYDLHFRYIPTRQDREQPNFPFTVEIYAKTISLFSRADTTSLYCPHGRSLEVFRKFIPNVIDFTGDSFWVDSIQNFKPNAVVIPDKGAAETILPYICKHIPYVNFILCEKTRDSVTGKLSNPIIHGDVTGKRLLIVDDICDGGGTFIQLADELKSKGASTLGLAVVHGIFSKGYKELNKRFETIYTTNSFRANPDFCIEVADDSHKVKMTYIR